MKHKFKFFRVGKKTYFHYLNGVFIKKNRLHSAALSSLAMLMAGSGFFAAYEYGLPAIKSTSYFQTKNIQVDNTVSAEPSPEKVSQEPIKQTDELLQFALKEKLNEFSGSQKWSVLAYDLSSDRVANINENDSFDAASLYKLFLLEALEEKLPFDKWEYTYHEGKSLAACVEEMLRTDDNPCSEALGEYIGWEFVDEQNKKKGFENTSLAGLSGRKTTVADVAELFIRLKKGQMLSDNTRRYVFDALYQQIYSKGLPASCGSCRGAVKSGELSDIYHSAGVITHGSKSYVLVVMSQNGNQKQLDEITKIVDARYGQPD